MHPAGAQLRGGGEGPEVQLAHLPLGAQANLVRFVRRPGEHQARLRVHQRLALRGDVAIGADGRGLGADASFQGVFRRRAPGDGGGDLAALFVLVHVRRQALVGAVVQVVGFRVLSVVGALAGQLERQVIIQPIVHDRSNDAFELIVGFVEEFLVAGRQVVGVVRLLLHLLDGQQLHRRLGAEVPTEMDTKLGLLRHRLGAVCDAVAAGREDDVFGLVVDVVVAVEQAVHPELAAGDVVFIGRRRRGLTAPGPGGEAGNIGRRAGAVGLGVRPGADAVVHEMAGIERRLE